jgi:DNA modification methylase
VTSWEAARELAASLAPVPDWVEGALSDIWIAPPFSVLNTNLAAWRERKRYWLSMGIQSELGRDDKLLTTGSGNTSEQNAALSERYGREIENGIGVYSNATSIFDPVLCELSYRWWAPPGGSVLDPFAGGSVRGVVAGYLGHPYTGIDLSTRQIISNGEQAHVILQPTAPLPKYIVGDSLEVLPRLTERFDLIMSCPPYFDLEVYSDDPSDLSRAESYPSFLASYRSIIRSAVALLKPNRFAIWIVGEVRERRDRNGGYVGLVPDTIAAFRDAGLTYYNELILITAVGSLPLRAGRLFEATRKVGKMHQNILVFLKGEVPRNWSAARANPPDPQQGLGL